MLTRGVYTLYMSTAKVRERRLACPILLGGPFVFNIPSYQTWRQITYSGPSSSRFPIPTLLHELNGKTFPTTFIRESVNPYPASW